MCEDTAPEGAVGRRVATQRKLAGLTQEQLANRAHVSRSLVSQVEQGAVPASAAFTTTIARALRVDVEALTGEPYGPPITDPKAEHAGIAALRIALDNEEDPDVEGFPLPTSELRTRLDQCQADREKSRYAQMLAVLPELLQHAYLIVNAAHPGQEAETAWALLDDAYALAQTVSSRFGYFDVAALAARCGRDAAVRVGDPLRAAVATLRYTDPRLRRGDYPGVLRVLDRGHALVEGQSSPAANAVRAELHLHQAQVQARSGHLDRADEHISEARRLVAGGVPAHPFYGVNSFAANVDFHWVAAAVELSDGTTAVGRAEQVQIPEHDEPSAAGRHWINVARGWTLHGDRAQALGALKKARALAPQKTRYDPGVRETVHLLAEHDRRANDTLAGFARWAGITL